MFVELAPEFVQPRAGTLGLELPELSADGALTGSAPSADAPAPGLVFERFLLRAVLDGEHALVILPAPPEESWSAPPADAPPESVVFPPLPTVGEAMLSDAGIGGTGARRAAIVIGASVPTRFRLLPR
jgi:hypothetical protein